ncbi:MAG: MucB/RseB C-terminal domain-containing protein [Burkholderiales bacterium]
MIQTFLAILVVASAGMSTPLRAEESEPGEAYDWLRVMAYAPDMVNYRGVFIHQYGNRVETLRVTHMLDDRGAHQKLEALDGIAREIIHSNDQAMCYSPGGGVVTVERRKMRKSFPSLLPRDVSNIHENYRVKRGNRERVAGYDCQVVILEARDPLRYGHWLCAEVNTGLLLEAAMQDARNEPVSRYVFTQLSITEPIDKNLLKPSGFETLRMERPRDTVSSRRTPMDSRWEIPQNPHGFKVIMQSRRQIAGKSAPVDQMVFSDGLVAVSVFIEPLAGDAPAAQGLSSQGAINVYAKSLDHHQVTVLGEVPVKTVMQIGDAVRPREK